MKLWFSYPEIDALRNGVSTPPANPLSANTNSSNANSMASSQSPLTQPQASLVAPHSGPGQLAGLAAPARPEAAKQNVLPSNASMPLNVTGEALVAKIKQTSQGTLVEDLSLSGGVTVTRDQASVSSPWPLTIEGSQLTLDSSDAGKLDATITGSPAKLAIGSGSLESGEIRSMNAGNWYGSISRSLQGPTRSDAIDRRLANPR